MDDNDLALPLSLRMRTQRSPNTSVDAPSRQPAERPEQHTDVDGGLPLSLRVLARRSGACAGAPQPSAGQRSPSVNAAGADERAVAVRMDSLWSGSVWTAQGLATTFWVNRRSANSDEDSAVSRRSRRSSASAASSSSSSVSSSSSSIGSGSSSDGCDSLVTSLRSQCTTDPKTGKPLRRRLLNPYVEQIMATCLLSVPRTIEEARKYVIGAFGQFMPPGAVVSRGYIAGLMKRHRIVCAHQRVPLVSPERVQRMAQEVAWVWANARHAMRVATARLRQYAAQGLHSLQSLPASHVFQLDEVAIWVGTPETKSARQRVRYLVTKGTTSSDLSQCARPKGMTRQTATILLISNLDASFVGAHIFFRGGDGPASTGRPRGRPKKTHAAADTADGSAAAAAPAVRASAGTGGAKNRASANVLKVDRGSPELSRAAVQVHFTNGRGVITGGDFPDVLDSLLAMRLKGVPAIVVYDNAPQHHGPLVPLVFHAHDRSIPLHLPSHASGLLQPHDLCANFVLRTILSRVMERCSEFEPEPNAQTNSSVDALIKLNELVAPHAAAPAAPTTGAPPAQAVAAAAPGHGALPAAAVGPARIVVDPNGVPESERTNPTRRNVAMQRNAIVQCVEQTILLLKERKAAFHAGWLRSGLARALGYTHNERTIYLDGHSTFGTPQASPLMASGPLRADEHLNTLSISAGPGVGTTEQSMKEMDDACGVLARALYRPKHLHDRHNNADGNNGFAATMNADVGFHLCSADCGADHNRDREHPCTRSHPDIGESDAPSGSAERAADFNAHVLKLMTLGPKGVSSARAADVLSETVATTLALARGRAAAADVAQPLTATHHAHAHGTAHTGTRAGSRVGFVPIWVDTSPTARLPAALAEEASATKAALKAAAPTAAAAARAARAKLVEALARDLRAFDEAATPLLGAALQKRVSAVAPNFEDAAAVQRLIERVEATALAARRSRDAARAQSAPGGAPNTCAASGDTVEGTAEAYAYDKGTQALWDAFSQSYQVITTALQEQVKANALKARSKAKGKGKGKGKGKKGKASSSSSAAASASASSAVPAVAPAPVPPSASASASLSAASAVAAGAAAPVPARAAAAAAATKVGAKRTRSVTSPERVADERKRQPRASPARARGRDGQPPPKRRESQRLHTQNASQTEDAALARAMAQAESESAIHAATTRARSASDSSDEELELVKAGDSSDVDSSSDSTTNRGDESGGASDARSSDSDDECLSDNE